MTNDQDCWDFDLPRNSYSKKNSISSPPHSVLRERNERRTLDRLPFVSL